MVLGQLDGALDSILGLRSKQIYFTSTLILSYKHARAQKWPAYDVIDFQRA